MDETKVLKGHFNELQPKSDNPTNDELFQSLPEVFVQISNGADNKSEVMTGYMILARNPSLHPGDIRIVRGVDRPGLRHLKDVIVLPMTGDRDVSSMCSGGDLDGDDYLVIWDRQLLPDKWNHEPMDFTPDPPAEVDSVSIDDITSFFVTYMMNDSLGSIATAHCALADSSPDGVKNPKCMPPLHSKRTPLNSQKKSYSDISPGLELAKLHSKAVDYAKSGQNAQMTSDLAPKRWPHWMEKRPKISYRSTKILGQLYDMVERVDFKPEYDTPFDERILHRFDLSNELLDSVAGMKLRYDAAVKRIMAQHAIATEFEVWSTFVMSHSQQGSDFKYHEVIGQLSTALKETFRTECHELAGGRDFEFIGPIVAAMYKVTSDEVLRAIDERRQASNRQTESLTSETPEGSGMPMISFPWLFSNRVRQICNRRRKGFNKSHGKPEHPCLISGTKETNERAQSVRVSKHQARHSTNKQRRYALG